MNLSISLDKLTPYNPGEAVTGKVLFVKSSSELKSSFTKPQGLKIQFMGKTTVRFTVIQPKSLPKTNCSTEVYFNASKFLVGNGTQEVPELSQSTSGIKEYPFSYTLPANIPASYKGTHGSVDYTITVTLKRSCGNDKEVSTSYKVTGESDIGIFRQNPRTNQSATIRKSSKIGMLWWSGTVYLNFHLKKKAYIPGEFVQFSAQIINDSNSKIHKAKLVLTQECIYYAEGSSHTVTHIIKKVKGPGVQPGESSVTWENSNLLKIPPLVPSNLGGFCRIIQANYFLHLILQPSSISLKRSTICCKLPITLGTKRGPSGRLSYPNQGTTGSMSGSLVFGNRVANIFSGSQNTTPRGTLERLNIDNGYYQNVIFPLARCFSAPVYENFRYSSNGNGSISNGVLTESAATGVNQGFIEEIDERYEPPPTYEEAMRILLSSPTSILEEEGSEDENELYQNSTVIENISRSICNSPRNPIDFNSPPPIITRERLASPLLLQQQQKEEMEQPLYNNF